MRFGGFVDELDSCSGGKGHGSIAVEGTTGIELIVISRRSGKEIGLVTRDNSVTKAKKIIVGSIIGLTIVFLSYSVTLFVGGQVSGEKVEIKKEQGDDFQFGF